MERVVGFDFDLGSVSGAYARAKQQQLNFLPLFLDAVNPSSALGWMQKERKGLQERANADCLVALAFIHHLCIARNIPVEQVVEWLLRLAPEGVVEFVGKEDETVIEMCALREDIFDNYTYQYFIGCLERKAKVIAKEEVPNSDRVLVHYRIDNPLWQGSCRV